ncbi:hypothetical protein RUM44_001663 [Polyplax serrata]|uniref:SEA domain-containing protein n=1 Tax=Polyplax serrata TaxID=468196 RepID=A0ABR1AKQ1_POLSC
MGLGARTSHNYLVVTCGRCRRICRTTRKLNCTVRSVGNQAGIVNELFTTIVEREEGLEKGLTSHIRLLTDGNGRNITNPYQESAKIKFSQISVLDTDNNIKQNDNNVENNSYLESLMDVYRRISDHIKEKTKSCGTFDVMCLLKKSKTEETPAVPSEPVHVPKPSGFIDIDNTLDGGDADTESVTHSRQVRSVKSRSKKMTAANNDDEDYMATEDSSGEIAEGSGEIHSYYKPSHVDGSDIHPYTTTTMATALSPGQPHYYRVNLKVNEPYREEYQDRSSPEYQSFQRSLVGAIEDLYQSVDGRQSVNLVNIQ